jgi:hypothetical protein
MLCLDFQPTKTYQRDGLMKFSNQGLIDFKIPNINVAHRVFEWIFLKTPEANLVQKEKKKMKNCRSNYMQNITVRMQLLK